MHTQIYLVKNLNLFLKNIIQTILKNSALLIKGKKIANINLLPREVLGLFILCTVARHLDPDNEWTIGSDRFGGDGVLACIAGEKKNLVLDTEQVYIPPCAKGNITSLVIDAINKKAKKGQEYYRNIDLVIFIDKFGLFEYEELQKIVHDRRDFSAYWVIGRSPEQGYIFFISVIKSDFEKKKIYKLAIDDDFLGWSIGSY